MTAQNTPGPWTATAQATVIAKDGFICKVAVQGAKDAEGEANAALIAAAPDLLAALLDFVAASEAIASGDTSMNLPWGTARAAIAKARDTQ